MSINLLHNTDFDYLKLLDWEVITNKLKQNCHFKSTHQLIDTYLSKKTEAQINLDFQIIEELIPSIEEFIEEFKQDSALLNNDIYPLLVEKLEKFHINDISELHQICLTCEISIFLNEKRVSKSWMKHWNFTVFNRIDIPYFVFRFENNFRNTVITGNFINSVKKIFIIVEFRYSNRNI